MIDNRSRRYWMFLARPERYDLEKHLIPGEQEPWPVNRFAAHIKEGDHVFFWRSGRQSGLMGWGTVLTDPVQMKGSAKLATVEVSSKQIYVDVSYDYRFDQPIPGDILRDAGLGTLHLLRNTTGTNFKVTTGEAMLLVDLLEGQGQRTPEPPYMQGEEVLPMDLVDPLTLGNSAQRILTGAGAFADPVSPQGLLLSLLAHTQRSNAKGTTAFFRDFFTHEIAPPGDQAAPPAAIETDALTILEAARYHAISSQRRERVGVRHLMSALLASVHPVVIAELEHACAESNQTLDAFVSGFSDTVQTYFEKDERDFWDHQIQLAYATIVNIKTAADQTASPQDRPSEDMIQTWSADAAAQAETGAKLDLGALAREYRGFVSSDRPMGGDHMRINAEVAVFAHVMSRQNPAQQSKELGAALALGLFGRWGAGKSFFIERLKENIRANSLLDVKDEQGERIYCQHIEQIEFNAWHYKEADLWASLVHHIFDELQRSFAEKNQEQDFKRLIAQLDMAKEQRAALVAEQNRLRLELKKATAEIARTEREIESRVDREMNNIAKAPWRLAQNEDSRKRLQELVPQVAGLLGIDESRARRNLAGSEASAAKLITTIRELNVKTHDAGQLSRSFLHASLSWSTLLIVAAVVAVLLIFHEDLNRWLEQSQQWLAAMVPPVTWVLSRMKKTSGIMQQIQGIQSNLEADIRLQQTQEHQTHQALRAEIDRLEESLSRRAEEEREVLQQLAETEQQIDALGSPQNLVEFINERASSDDYRARLGILALIRKDFTTLSNIMTQPGHDKEKATINLDRIILYIDDLDRVNNSNKVTRVMEAVHLLMSLPLFNVVVAVDEWWAAHSVARAYDQYFMDVDDQASETLPNAAPGSPIPSSMLGHTPDIGRKATPREFLEKVFQLCLWVKPLGQELAERLIDGNIPVDSPRPTFATPAGANNVINIDDVVSGDQTHNRPEAQRVVQDSAAEARLSRLSGNNGDDEVDHFDEDEEDYHEAGAINTLTVRDEDLAISFQERETIKLLARVVGRSPRTVKRFINTYRILKAITLHRLIATSEEENAKEEAENQIAQAHQAILFLLSIQIGQTETARNLFELFDETLAEQDTYDLEVLLQDTKSQPPDEVPEALWKLSCETLDAVLKQEGLQLGGLSSLNDWLADCARFGFEEWEPRVERLWKV